MLVAAHTLAKANPTMVVDVYLSDGRVIPIGFANTRH